MIIVIEREDLGLYSFIFGFIFGIGINNLINKTTKKLSLQKEKVFSKYFYIEILTAFLSLALFTKLGFNKEFLLWIVFSYSLFTLSIIDLRYKLVPDYFLLLALVLSFFVTPFNIYEALKNAFIFAGFFALLEFVLTFYIQNIKSKLTKNETLKEQKALGEGDIPILAVIGAVLGIKAGIVAIFLASVFAIIPSIYYVLKKKESQTPFIPFLVMGFLFEFFLNLSTKVFS